MTNPTQPPLLPVSEAAREAAKELYRYMPNAIFQDLSGFERGEADDGIFCQAFARFEVRLAERAGEEIAHLRHIIDRDRYIVAAGVVAIKDQIRGREWLQQDGRGNYEWDDERYKEEFGDAVEAIYGALEPLSRVAWDKSDCDNIEERVIAARNAAKDMLKQPLGPREMVRADILGLSTPPSDGQGLREALEEIIADIDVRARNAEHMWQEYGAPNIDKCDAVLGSTQFGAMGAFRRLAADLRVRFAALSIDRLSSGTVGEGG